MKNLSRAFQILCCVFAIWILSACEIRKKGAKDDDGFSEQGRAAVGSFFVIEQAAISNSSLQDLRSAMSTLMGRGVVMTEDSTFEKWFEPKMGCRPYSEDLADVGLIRSLDIGDLTVKDPVNPSVVINKNPKDFYFAARGLLNVGAASLWTGGQKGSFAVNHNFTVPDVGSLIEFENINSGSKERLPAPLVVNQPDSGQPDADNYYVSLSRSSAYRITYRAPAGASYVRVTIADNPSNSSNWVVCYGEPDANILVPQSTFSNMRATQEALMTVDFVTASVIRNIPRMKESVVITYSRHYHGRRDMNDLGLNEPAFFGRLILE